MCVFQQKRMSECYRTQNEEEYSLTQCLIRSLTVKTGSFKVYTNGISSQRTKLEIYFILYYGTSDRRP